MALTHTPPADLGKKISDFHLLATDGKKYRLQDFQNGKPIVVMFICNHCPYVKAIEDRLIQLGHDLKALDVNVVAICSNDAQNYPEDSYANLKKRAEEKNYPFVYLHDADQSVAKKWGAVCTPDYFVTNGSNEIQYRGRLDDSWKDPQLVTKRELYNAVLQILETNQGPNEQTPSMGCSIKWIHA